MQGSHSNRKATKAEMAAATEVIRQAYPQYDVVWGSTATTVAIGRRATTRWPSACAIPGASTTRT